MSYPMAYDRFAVNEVNCCTMHSVRSVIYCIVWDTTGTSTDYSPTLSWTVERSSLTTVVQASGVRWSVWSVLYTLSHSSMSYHGYQISRVFQMSDYLLDWPRRWASRATIWVLYNNTARSSPIHRWRQRYWTVDKLMQRTFFLRIDEQSTISWSSKDISNNVFSPLSFFTKDKPYSINYPIRKKEETQVVTSL